MSLKRVNISDSIQNNTQSSIEVYNHPLFNHNNSLGGVIATYYHINPKSTAARGSNLIGEIIGDDSPLRFDKIKDYKIIMNSSTASQEESEEQGLTYNTDLTCYTYPDGVEPFTNDLIIFSHMPNTLYKVTKAEKATILEKTYWSIDITVHLVNDGANFEALEKQVTDNYTFRSDLLTGKEIRMIRDDDLDIVDRIDEAYELLVNDFKDVFMHPLYKYIRAVDGSKDVLVPDVVEFINTHDLLSLPNDIFVAVHDTPIDSDFKASYGRGLLNKLSTGKVPNLANYKFGEVTYSQEQLKFYKTLHNGPNIVVLSNSRKRMNTMAKYDMDGIIELEPFTDEELALSDVEDLLSEIENGYPEDDTRTLIYTVYKLLRMKQIKNELLTKNNNYNNYNRIIGG